MSNPICEMLGIRYPIIQGAMTNVTDVGLVSAVSNAGGIGIFAPGIENVDIEFVRSQIRALRIETANHFGINIMLASPYAPQIVDLVCEEQVPFVTTGAGSPAKYMEKLKAAHIIVAPVVSAKEAAVKMEAAGVDFIIAEGMESGGYIGRLSTFSLIPQVVDAVKIPVAAAGGIADGRGLAAALMLGACGVQMGTRFLASKECAIPDWCKEALLNAGAKDAIVLGDRIGAKARLRVLKTDITAEILRSESAEAGTVEQFEAMVTQARQDKYDKGLGGTLIGTGECVSLIHSILPVSDIISEMITVYRGIVKKTCKNKSVRWRLWTESYYLLLV